MGLSLANTISKVLLFNSLFGFVEKLVLNVQSSIKTIFPKLVSWRNMQISNTKTPEDEEMKALIDRLGMVCGLEGIDETKSFGKEDFKSLFEEEEPSTDEIKETFGVFDLNNDGFIDASELQEVVCSLKLMEKCELEKCMAMIKAFDANGDGLIDFQEFVTFMDECLYCHDV